MEKKDWQLISDEATIYGSAEISTKLSYSSKVEEIGSVIRRGCANTTQPCDKPQSEIRAIRESTLTKERRYRNN